MWWLRLSLIAGAGLAVRVGYILLVENPYRPNADALFYEGGSQALVNGLGFIDGAGYVLTFGLRRRPSAFHPPAYTVYLASSTWLGFGGVLHHQIATAVLGTGTVVVVGLLGRRLGGPRAGLIAAGFAAIYPNLWFSDVFLMSESLSIFATAVAVLIAYRCVSRPSLGAMALLGAVCGVATLSRSESVLLGPLLAGAVALLVRGSGWQRRLALGGVAVATSIVVVAPWVLFNMNRFERTEYLSTGFGNLLDTSNCPKTYSGDRLGSYYGLCQPALNRYPEESRSDYYERQRAIRHITGHLDRLPVVLLARVGRTWGLYRPIQVIQLDHKEPQEPRELPAAYLGLAMYYLLCALSVAGVLALRRQHRPLSPLLVPIILVTLVAMATNGQTRYRASAEVSLVVLAAIGVGQARRPPSATTMGEPSPDRTSDTMTL